LTFSPHDVSYPRIFVFSGKWGKKKQHILLSIKDIRMDFGFCNHFSHEGVRKFYMKK
jgi:hypothetical protein